MDMVINFRNKEMPLEFLVEKNGKRFLSEKEVRALRSKISLKFPLAADVKGKAKMSPSIKQSILDDFERAYKRNCN